MQTDLHTRGSLPLAHDHFRASRGRETVSDQEGALPPVADRREAARRASGQAMRHIAEAARQALKAGKHATTRTIAAARWSGEQTFRYATVLKTAFTRPAVAPTAIADGFGELSQYASVPNRLSALATFSQDQHTLVRASLPGRRTHQAGSTILAEGEQTPHPTFILSGWAARTRVENGKLHVLGILLPGDGICLFRPPCAVASTTLIALTTLETAEAGPLLELAQEADVDSPLRLSMHRAMAEDEAFLLNQTMRLMMKPAAARLAHLLLELQYRLARVGLATDTEMPFALDRRMLAAALGLSPGAVGGVVRTLEHRKIARFGHNRLVIRRESILRKLAGFTPPAFSEGSGRRLISDDCAGHASIEPGPWMGASARRSSQAQEVHQHPT